MVASEHAARMRSMRLLSRLQRYDFLRMAGTDAAMNYDHIFIITYARSGSTLLQGVLNSIPGILIRGENMAAVRHLFNAWRAIDVSSQKVNQQDDDPTHPWFGASGASTEEFGRDLAQSFVSRVLRPQPDTVACGFKEIRYYRAGCPSLEGEIDFMRRFFPRACFIINTRDIGSTVGSLEKVKFGVGSEETIASDERLREYASLNRPDVAHVHYDDYKDSPEALQSLFDFLGVSPDIDVVASTLNIQHSVRA